MMLAKGPRPWAIRLFAGIALLVAIANFGRNMMRLDLPFAIGGMSFDPSADHDLLIVIFSAQLTIAAIPIALIWFYASNFARLFVALMALLSLPGIVGLHTGLAKVGVFDWSALGLSILPFLAITLLFTPSSRHWFAKGPRPDEKTFE